MNVRHGILLPEFTQERPLKETRVSGLNTHPNRDPGRKNDATRQQRPRVLFLLRRKMPSGRAHGSLENQVIRQKNRGRWRRAAAYWPAGHSAPESGKASRVHWPASQVWRRLFLPVLPWRQHLFFCLAAFLRRSYLFFNQIALASLNYIRWNRFCDTLICRWHGFKAH